MKKIINMVLILCILLMNIPVYANSGPSYWEGKQSSEILTIDDNSPIYVESEDLIFDFTDEDYNNYSLSAKVTAKYMMSNDTENAENVQMAFPFISSIGSFNPEAIHIKAEDEELEFQIFLGDMLNSRTIKDEDDMHFDFSSIAKSITSLEYIPKNYKLDDKGTLHTYDLNSNDENNLNVAIGQSSDENKSRIIAKGFNGFQMSDGVESYISRNIENIELEMFVIGEDVELIFKAYSDVDLKDETDKYSLDLSSKEISIRDYINDVVEIFKEEVDCLDYLADNQIFNLIAKQLDFDIGKNTLNMEKESLISRNFDDMFIVLIYQVDFQANSKRDISVSYNSSGTMDKTETKEPVYTFAYILNPAKNWASFKNLNIEIKPPVTSSNIIDSSLELTRKEDGTYVGNFETLPDEDFFFSLYHNEKITTMDKIKGSLSRNYYGVFILVMFLLAVLIGSIIVISFNKLKKSN